MAKQIQVGLIGFGMAGQIFHAPLIQIAKGLHLAKIVTSRKELAEQLYPSAEVVPSAKDVFSDPSIDLVVIATPNDSHYPLAKEAILASKHVVIDKPFVIDSSSAMELHKLSEEQGVLLSVFHNRRWDNNFLTLKHVIAEGLLGKIHTYHAHFHRYRPKLKSRWRDEDSPGAGVLYDLGSHLIDQALVLFGNPDTVYAELLNQRGPKKKHAPDYFHLILGYGNRRRVYLHAGSLVKEPGPRYEVHGTEGSFFKYGIDGQEEALKKGIRPDHPTWGLDQPEFYAKLYDKESERSIPTLRGRYELYYEQIYKAIQDQAENPVTAVEAMRVIQVIEKAIQSDMEKRVIQFNI